MNRILNLVIINLMFVSGVLFCDDKEQAGIDEKPGAYLPRDVTVFDEYGQPQRLSSLINKPVIFNLVYFRCPGLCSPLLSGVAEVSDKMDLEAGRDYDIITISFDPRENYITAVDKKKNYLESMKRKIPENSWRFLTADSVNIAKVCSAVGWKYLRQGNDYIHGSGLIVLSKEGKISRYMYGTSFLPADMKMALTEASEGRVGTTISKLVSLCYSYDAQSKKYVLNITRIAGTGVILMVIALFAFLTLKKRKPLTPKGI